MTLRQKQDLRYATRASQALAFLLGGLCFGIAIALLRLL